MKYASLCRKMILSLLIYFTAASSIVSTSLCCWSVITYYCYICVHCHCSAYFWDRLMSNSLCCWLVQMYLCCVFSTAGMDLRGCTPVHTSDCAVDQCWSIGVASLFTVIAAFKTAVCGCCSGLNLVSTSCWWLVSVYNCYCHHPQPLWPPRQLCVVVHLYSSWCPPLCAVDQCWGSLSTDIIAFKTALCGCSPELVMVSTSLCCWPVLRFTVHGHYSLQDSFVWLLTSVLLTTVDIHCPHCAVDQCWHLMPSDIIAFKTALCGHSPLCCWRALTCNCCIDCPQPVWPAPLRQACVAGPRTREMTLTGPLTRVPQQPRVLDPPTTTHWAPGQVCERMETDCTTSSWESCDIMWTRSTGNGFGFVKWQCQMWQNVLPGEWGSIFEGE